MIEKAKVSDVREIQKLINFYAPGGGILPRSLNDLYEQMRDFFIYWEDDIVVGVCALHVSWEDLAEIRSLAVKKEYQGRGIGRQLVIACLKEARQLGISRVFVLTNQPKFFEKVGFKLITRSELPHKIWADCIKCIKFPDCDEIPLLYRIQEKSVREPTH